MVAARVAVWVEVGMEARVVTARVGVRMTVARVDVRASSSEYARKRARSAPGAIHNAMGAAGTRDWRPARSVGLCMYV